jgi:hypothetical protein
VRPKSKPCRRHPRASEFLNQWDSVPEGDFVRVRAYLRLPAYAPRYHTVRRAPAGSSLGASGAGVVKSVGLNPRFSFALCVATGDEMPLRLIFPAQYSMLATEASLIQGQLTFVGKVLTKLPAKSLTYRDVQTYQRFRPELDGGLDRLWSRLGVDHKTLRKDVQSYYMIQGPAALVMPVAVYK